MQSLSFSLFFRLFSILFASLIFHVSVFSFVSVEFVRLHSKKGTVFPPAVVCSVAQLLVFVWLIRHAFCLFPLRSTGLTFSIWKRSSDFFNKQDYKDVKKSIRCQAKSVCTSNLRKFLNTIKNVIKAIKEIVSIISRLLHFSIFTIILIQLSICVTRFKE